MFGNSNSKSTGMFGSSNTGHTGAFSSSPFGSSNKTSTLSSFGDTSAPTKGYFSSLANSNSSAGGNSFGSSFGSSSFGGNSSYNNFLGSSSTNNNKSLNYSSMSQFNNKSLDDKNKSGFGTFGSSSNFGSSFGSSGSFYGTDSKPSSSSGFGSTSGNFFTSSSNPNPLSNQSSTNNTSNMWNSNSSWNSSSNSGGIFGSSSSGSANSALTAGGIFGSSSGVGSSGLGGSSSTGQSFYGNSKQVANDYSALFGEKKNNFFNTNSNNSNPFLSSGTTSSGGIFGSTSGTSSNMFSTTDKKPDSYSMAIPSSWKFSDSDSSASSFGGSSFPSSTSSTNLGGSGSSLFSSSYNPNTMFNSTTNNSTGFFGSTAPNSMILPENLPVNAGRNDLNNLANLDPHRLLYLKEVERKVKLLREIYLIADLSDKTGNPKMFLSLIGSIDMSQFWMLDDSNRPGFLDYYPDGKGGFELRVGRKSEGISSILGGNNSTTNSQNQSLLGGNLNSTNLQNSQSQNLFGGNFNANKTNTLAMSNASNPSNFSFGFGGNSGNNNFNSGSNFNTSFGSLTNTNNNINNANNANNAHVNNDGIGCHCKDVENVFGVTVKYPNGNDSLIKSDIIQDPYGLGIFYSKNAFSKHPPNAPLSAVFTNVSENSVTVKNTHENLSPQIKLVETKQTRSVYYQNISDYVADSLKIPSFEKDKKSSNQSKNPQISNSTNTVQNLISDLEKISQDIKTKNENVNKNQNSKNSLLKTNNKIDSTNYENNHFEISEKNLLQKEIIDSKFFDENLAKDDFFSDIDVSISVDGKIQFKQIDSKNDKIDSKNDEIELKNDKIDPKNDEIELKNDKIELKNDKIELKNDKISSKNDKIELKNDKIASKNDKIASKNDKISSKNQNLPVGNIFNSESFNLFPKNDSNSPTEIEKSQPKTSLLKITEKLPKLTKKGYWALPFPFQRFQNLDKINSEEIPTEKMLSRVFGLVIGSEFGTIAWSNPVDCRCVDFDRDVSIVFNAVEVYPDEKFKQDIGFGLNKPAVVTLYGIAPEGKKNKKISKATAKKFKKFLKKSINQMGEGVKFISWDGSSLKLIFSVDHFSRYEINLTPFNKMDKTRKRKSDSKLDNFSKKEKISKSTNSLKNFGIKMNKISRVSFAPNGLCLKSNGTNLVLVKNLNNSKINFFNNDQNKETFDKWLQNEISIDAFEKAKSLVKLSNILYNDKNEYRKILKFKNWLKLYLKNQVESKFSKEDEFDSKTFFHLILGERSKAINCYLKFKNKKQFILNFLIQCSKFEFINSPHQKSKKYSEFSQLFLKNNFKLTHFETKICLLFVYFAQKIENFESKIDNFEPKMLDFDSKMIDFDPKNDNFKQKINDFDQEIINLDLKNEKNYDSKKIEEKIIKCAKKNFQNEEILFSLSFLFAFSPLKNFILKNFLSKFFSLWSVFAENNDFFDKNYSKNPIFALLLIFSDHYQFFQLENDRNEKNCDKKFNKFEKIANKEKMENLLKSVINSNSFGNLKTGQIAFLNWFLVQKILLKINFSSHQIVSKIALEFFENAFEFLIFCCFDQNGELIFKNNEKLEKEKISILKNLILNGISKLPNNTTFKINLIKTFCSHLPFLRILFENCKNYKNDKNSKKAKNTYFNQIIDKFDEEIDDLNLTKLKYENDNWAILDYFLERKNFNSALKHIAFVLPCDFLNKINEEKNKEILKKMNKSKEKIEFWEKFGEPIMIMSRIQTNFYQTNPFNKEKLNQIKNDLKNIEKLKKFIQNDSNENKKMKLNSKIGFFTDSLQKLIKGF